MVKRKKIKNVYSKKKKRKGLKGKTKPNTRKKLDTKNKKL